MTIEKLPTIARQIQQAVRTIGASAVAEGVAVAASSDKFTRLRPVAEKLLASASQQYGRNMSEVARHASLPPAARAAAFRERHEVSLAGKTAVVTGAGGNIGAETAYAMANRGMNVVLADRPGVKLGDIAETCKLLGAPSVLESQHDLTTATGQDSLVKETLSAYGAPYAVVHSAGMYMEGGLYHRDPIERAKRKAQYDLMMKINVEVPVTLTEQFAEHMQPGGHVTAINSLAGEKPVEGEALYCSSKSALDNAWETMRKEMGPRGIKLSQIFPSALLGKMAEGREGLEAELLHFPNPIARAVEAIVSTMGNSNLPRIPVHGVISPYAQDHK